MGPTETEEDQPTVLVVDDDADTADVHADVLADDYAVRRAYSGEEALELMGPDVAVVLLDRRMPGISGDEVLERIRERYFDCRVVMVTAVDPDTDIIDMSFDDYLVKPVTPEDLRDAVERMLVRNAHDDKIQKMVAVASKMATLEAKMDIDELNASEEYASLEAQFVRLRDEIEADGGADDLYTEFSTEKIQSVLDG
jgi:DNA-binding response OmpR family regulator